MSTPEPFGALCASTATLDLALFTAYQRLNPVGETAAVDQIRAHLTPPATRTERGTALALAPVLAAAELLRTHLATRGCRPAQWRVQGLPGAHRSDFGAHAVAQRALTLELNQTGAAADHIHGYMTFADPGVATALVVEAAWMAATIHRSLNQKR